MRSDITRRMTKSGQCAAPEGPGPPNDNRVAVFKYNRISNDERIGCIILVEVGFNKYIETTAFKYLIFLIPKVTFGFNSHIENG